MDKPVARGRLLVVCAVLAFLLLALAITAWAQRGQQNDAKLCVVLVTILDRSQASLPSNPFFKEHPELLARAQRDNRDALRDLHTVC